MADRNDPIEKGLTRIERTNRILIGILSATFIVMCSALVAAFSQSAPLESLRARTLIIEQNRIWLEFIGTQTNQVIRRRIGLSGDETTRTPK